MGDFACKLISSVILNGFSSGFDRKKGKGLTLNVSVTVFGFSESDWVYF